MTTVSALLCIFAFREHKQVVYIVIEEKCSMQQTFGCCDTAQLYLYFSFYIYIYCFYNALSVYVFSLISLRLNIQDLNLFQIFNYCKQK